MSLGTFRLIFTTVAFVITLVISLATQVNLVNMLATVGFIAGVACLSDVVFIKIYMMQNKDKINDLMKELGENNGTDKQP